MNVWLITIGEPLPTDPGENRLLRCGIMADLLSHHGHKVTWWTSAFDHAKKRHRVQSNSLQQISENCRIQYLHGCGYKKNISITRLIDHAQVAKLFLKYTNGYPKPDIILCSLPPLELCEAGLRYARRHDVPIIIDIRDLWPDLFLDFIPAPFRFLGRMFLFPLFVSVNNIFRKATGITGLTLEFVNWGLSYARRPIGKTDSVFPMGYVEKVPDLDQQKKSRIYWDTMKISKDTFNIVFIGSFGKQFELSNVIEAAKILSNKFPTMRFIICGDGDNSAYYLKLGAGCNSILFPGWIGTSDIWVLLRMSSLGLAPYIKIKNFEMNIANKPIEYLSAGLPILTTSDGSLGRLLAKEKCGRIYNDTKSLVSIIEELYNDVEQRTVLSDNALRTYKLKFVAESVYTKFESFLEDVIKLRVKQL
jgi:glycosyltransferase involved in cell wall biosynthesis